MPDQDAYAWCAQHARAHYENFPVASLLLPHRLRRPITAIYAFARSADDIADEGDHADATRLALLDDYRRRLDDIKRGAVPDDAVLFTALADTIRRHALPLEPFYDLLAAFRQDVIKKRYADFSEVLAYCRLSANPVGRLLLQLFRHDSDTNIALADNVCTGLQLTNFLQDVRADFNRGRMYLAQDALHHHGVTEDHLRLRRHDRPWQSLMAQEIERARAYLARGAGLGARLPGRMGLEIRLTIAGGLTVLDKLQMNNASGDNGTARLTPWDWIIILWRSRSLGR